MTFSFFKILAFFSVVFPCFSNSKRIEFIKSFVQNEGKPTHVMFELCWGRRAEVILMKEMSKIGVRSSRSMLPSKYLDQGLLFLLDLECPDAEDVIFKATSRRLFMQPYRWMVFANSYRLEENTILETMPILTDSDLVKAEKTEDGFQMMELYKRSPQSALQSSLRGYYNGTLTDVRPHRALFRRRRDLRGIPLTMAIAIQDSNSTHQHFEDRLESQYDYISKVSWLIVRLGFEMLGAAPQHVWSYRFGYVVNGTWTGMIQDMIVGKADVGKLCGWSSRCWAPHRGTCGGGYVVVNGTWTGMIGYDGRQGRCRYVGYIPWHNTKV